MNIVQIESRLNYLEKYDRKVRNYFNPKATGRKHRYIIDLIADHKIDSELYGLGSYWKPEINLLDDSPLDLKPTNISHENEQPKRSPDKSIKKVKFGKLRDLELIHLDSGLEKESYKGAFAHTKLPKHPKSRARTISPMGRSTQVNHFLSPELCEEELSFCSTKLSSVIESNLTARSNAIKPKVVNVVDINEILNELSFMSDQDSVIHTLPTDILQELSPKNQSFNDILIKSDYKNFTLNIGSAGECKVCFKDLTEPKRPEVTLIGNIDEYGNLLYDGSRYLDLSTILPWSKSYNHLKGHILLISVNVANHCIFQSYILLDTSKSKNLFRARNEIKRYKLITELNQQHQRAYLPSIRKIKETHLNSDSPIKEVTSRLAYPRSVTPVVNSMTNGLYNYKNKLSLFRVNAYPAHLSEYERFDGLTSLCKSQPKKTERTNEENSFRIKIKGNGLKLN